MNSPGGPSANDVLAPPNQEPHHPQHDCRLNLADFLEMSGSSFETPFGLLSNTIFSRALGSYLHRDELLCMLGA